MTSHNSRFKRFLFRPVESSLSSQHGPLSQVIGDLCRWNEQLQSAETKRVSFFNDIFWEAVSPPGHADKTRNRFAANIIKLGRSFNQVSWQRKLDTKQQKAIETTLQNILTEMEGFQDALQTRIEILKDSQPQDYRLEAMSEEEGRSAAILHFLDIAYRNNQDRMAAIEASFNAVQDGLRPQNRPGLS